MQQTNCSSWADTSPRTIQLSPWQRKVAGLVQSVDELNTLVLAGGRGGGKSILLIWLIGYFALISGDSFNGVLIRRDLAGLSKLEDLLFQQIPTLTPGSKYFNAKRQWRHSNGGTLRLIHMDAGDAFNKIEGEDLSHIFWDELGQKADPQVVLRARSSMRTTDPTVVPNSSLRPTHLDLAAGGFGITSSPRRCRTGFSTASFSVHRLRSG